MPRAVGSRAASITLRPDRFMTYAANPGVLWGNLGCHSLTRLSRNALVTTDTELSAMAAPAKIGDNNRPNTG